jgi:type IV secretion system protein VirB11
MRSYPPAHGGVGTSGGIPALDLALRSLSPWLRDPAVTEVCINRPGEAFVERQGGHATVWHREPLPFADFDWCLRLAKLVGHATRQRIDEEAALMSASLPAGERIQIVVPPTCERDTVAISIRRPADHLWSIEDLQAKGLFELAHGAGVRRHEDDQLPELLRRRNLAAFFTQAVRDRKNILVCGATGSGKTTFTKSLIREIPEHERLISIEDAAELRFDHHPNHVRLFYSKDGQGLAKVTPRRLLESCLRMRPDRILLAELRGDEAFDYVRSVCSGHPGSITSIHAASCSLAFEQLVLLIQQHPASQQWSRADIRSLLTSLIDIVVHFSFVGGRRFISDVWYASPVGTIDASGRILSPPAH